MSFDELREDMERGDYIPTFEDLKLAIMEAYLADEDDRTISLIWNIAQRMEGTHVMTPQAEFEKTEQWIEEQHNARLEFATWG